MPAPYCYEYPRPMVTVDLAVFSLIEQSLRVLLICRGREPFAGKWAIPGGFLEMDEPAAGRRPPRAARGDRSANRRLDRADRLLRQARSRPAGANHHAGSCGGRPCGRTRDTWGRRCRRGSMDYSWRLYRAGVRSRRDPGAGARMAQAGHHRPALEARARALTEVLPHRGRSCTLPDLGTASSAGRTVAEQNGEVAMH